MIYINIDQLQDDEKELMQVYFASYPEMFKELPMKGAQFLELKNRAIFLKTSNIIEMNKEDYTFYAVNKDTTVKDMEIILSNCQHLPWKHKENEKSPRHLKYKFTIGVKQPYPDVLGRTVTKSFEGRLLRKIPDHTMMTLGLNMIQLHTPEKNGNGFTIHKYDGQTTPAKLKIAYNDIRADAFAQLMTWLVEQRYHFEHTERRILVPHIKRSHNWTNESEIGITSFHITPHGMQVYRKMESGATSCHAHIPSYRVEHYIISAMARKLAICYGLTHDNKRIFQYFDQIERYIKFVRSDKHALQWDERPIFFNLTASNAVKTSDMSSLTQNKPDYIEDVVFLIERSKYYDTKRWNHANAVPTIYNKFYDLHGLFSIFREYPEHPESETTVFDTESEHPTA